MTTTPARRPLGPGPAGALDALTVLVFAAVGRASHDEGGAVTGTLAVAWPFLVGTLVGWVLVRRRSRRWPTDLGPGVLVWASTLVVGMLLRLLTGAGVAFTFVLVAAVFLGVVLVGWRVLLPRLPRRS